MQSSPPATRRTRFVLVSDTHKFTPALPRGDVLIHAGDLTNQGTFPEISRAVAWLEKADFECKIVVAGNHDLSLDRVWNASHGAGIHQATSTREESISLLTSSPSITYLEHTSARVRLSRSDGPHTTFKVFGSPRSPRQASHGTFSAFTYSSPLHDLAPTGSDDLPSVWNDIPLDADVVVTHTPPRTHCDESHDRHAAGCEALRRALWRVRPRLAVCGHVHEGRGSERVVWDLTSGNVSFKEAGVRRWEDPEPEGRKMCLINLTIKGGDALRNDGSGLSLAVTSLSSAAGESTESRDCTIKALPEPALYPKVAPDVSGAWPRLGTRGLGGDPFSARTDQTALVGRLGRRETCIVNCAIMSKSYPHIGGRKMNKPIVVDLDLPIWDASTPIVTPGE